MIASNALFRPCPFGSESKHTKNTHGFNINTIARSKLSVVHQDLIALVQTDFHCRLAKYCFDFVYPEGPSAQCCAGIECAFIRPDEHRSPFTLVTTRRLWWLLTWWALLSALACSRTFTGRSVTNILALLIAECTVLQVNDTHIHAVLGRLVSELPLSSDLEARSIGVRFRAATEY